MNQRKTGAILSYSIVILNIIVGLLYTPYMLEKMGQNEFGLYSLVASVIGYLTILDFGFGNAVIRYTAKFRAEGREKEQSAMYGMFIMLYSIIGLLAIIAGAFLYYNIDTLFGDTMQIWELQKARILVMIMIVNIAFTFPLSIFRGIITAYEDFIFVRVIQLLRILLNTLLMVVLLYYGYKAIAMAVVMTIFNLGTLIINYIYAKKHLKITIQFKRVQLPFVREVFIYSFWIFLNIVIDKLYWNTGQFVLGAFVGTVAVSVFALAIQLLNMYMNFSVSIVSVFLPKVTQIVSSNTPDSNKEISDLFVRIGRLQNYIMLFILLGFTLFGQQFITLWAGAEYQETYIIALMFFVALYIPLIQNLGYTILQARNELKFRSLLYLFIAVGCFILQIPLTKYYGGIGCATAILISFLLGTGLIMNLYYHRVQHIDIRSFWKQIVQTSIPLIVVAVLYQLIMRQYSSPITLAPIPQMIVEISIFTIIYWGVAYFISMNKSEKHLVETPVRKLLNHRFNK